ncbi:toxin-antitoxin system HicB family antitoxin [Novosphingobium sp.]|uniref:toxin-antitoxin system HicB family antitoxin n=1 Tax=Novosphingobium sp. TaxID=1874826 RepID=UPI00286A0619|nr:toxin-antitoxin system HicB family antitoxin [Novosphingobium sp.]
MTRASYPLKLPASVKAAAARLAKEDGVSLNQWISVAIAQKIGVVETAADFLRRQAGKAKPEDMLPFLDRAKREAPPVGDEI